MRAFLLSKHNFLVTANPLDYSVLKSDARKKVLLLLKGFNNTKFLELQKSVQNVKIWCVNSTNWKYPHIVSRFPLIFRTFHFSILRCPQYLQPNFHIICAPFIQIWLTWVQFSSICMLSARSFRIHSPLSPACLSALVWHCHLYWQRGSARFRRVVFFIFFL